MNKIYLVIYNRKTKSRFVKYFETEYDKDRYKYKVMKYSTTLFIIEDSTDIYFTE